ncbi:hypothetical protein LPJ70_005392, partial [Coemansia sp. RSA 2708]
FSSSPKSSYFELAEAYKCKHGEYPDNLLGSTLVGRDNASKHSSIAHQVFVPPPMPSPPPVPLLKPDFFAAQTARLDEESSIQNGDAELYAHTCHYGGPPVGKKLRTFVVAMRVVHTLVGLLMMACFGAMEAYMLIKQFVLAVIPLTVCRIILIIALLVLILSDWAVPKRIHRYFPMFNFQHSLKALGLSQMVIAFFALGDSTLTSMEADRKDSTFARLLFPLVILTSSLLLAISAVYFIIGVFGGAKLRTRMLVK